MKHYKGKKLGTKRICQAYTSTFVAEGSQEQELGSRGHGGLVLMATSSRLIHSDLL